MSDDLSVKPFDPYADPEVPQPSQPEEPKTSWLDKLAKALPFIKQHKNTLWGCLLLIVGALGGNADRVAGLWPDAPPVDCCAEIQVQLTELKDRVNKLEGDKAQEHIVAPEPEPSGPKKIYP